MIFFVTAVPVGLIIFWIAKNTSWVDVRVPMPPRGEALTNPFYAAQRFAEALGAHTTWDRLLIDRPADSTIVLSTWHWSLTAARRQALERWVESGGRLVVDDTLTGGEEEFARWSGIRRVYPDPGHPGAGSDPEQQTPCRSFFEAHDASPSSPVDGTPHVLCDLDTTSHLTTTKPAVWVLRNATGIQVLCVRIGRGSVTVINSSPFRYRDLFDGDHGWLLVRATELHPGDVVHFLSEDDHPSLLALTWQHGAPVVLLTLVVIGLLLWRDAVRFGPLAARQHGARRSLAEQIRGTGRFVLQYGTGESLHAASVRALDEAAERRVPQYARLTAGQRAAALARLTGFDANAVAEAMYHPHMRRASELRNTIALLEAARRRILIPRTRSSHGAS
jgi:hypothetical protein